MAQNLFYLCRQNDFFEFWIGRILFDCCNCVLGVGCNNNCNNNLRITAFEKIEEIIT